MRKTRGVVTSRAGLSRAGLSRAGTGDSGPERDVSDGRGGSWHGGSWRDEPVVWVIVATTLTTAVLALWVGLRDLGSPSYARAAADVLAGGHAMSTYRPPLYPVFLAGVMAAAGDEWRAATAFVQWSVAVLTGVVVIDVVRILGARRGARRLAAVGYASHLFLLLEIFAVRETTLYVALCAVWLRLLVAPGGRLTARYAAAGGLAGLAHLTRPTGGLLLLGTLTSLAFGKADEERPASRRAAAAAAAVAVACVVVFPWQRHVSAVTGRPTFASSTTAGLNAFKGNNPLTARYYPLFDVDALDRHVTARTGRAASDPLLSNVLLKEAAGHVAADPLGAVSFGLVKFLWFFSPVPTPLGTASVREGEGGLELAGHRFRHPLPVAAGTLHACVLSAGVLFAVSGLRRRRRPSDSAFVWACVPVVVATALVHAVTFPETRFRLPIDLFSLVCLGAYAASPARSGAAAPGRPVGGVLGPDREGPTIGARPLRVDGR